MAEKEKKKVVFPMLAISVTAPKSAEDLPKPQTSNDPNPAEFPPQTPESEAKMNQYNGDMQAKFGDSTKAVDAEIDDREAKKAALQRHAKQSSPRNEMVKRR